MTRVTVADYGVGNIFSISRALETIGVDAIITEDPGEIKNAERLIIPGVGAFSTCMERMQARGFQDEILAFAATERPLLGICVGMQILFDASEEFGHCRGLGLIPGEIKQVPSNLSDGTRVKLPNIGWLPISPPKGRTWQDTLLAETDPGEPVYFVHSFVPAPKDPEDRLATFAFNGHTLTAAAQRGNLIGVQFHPERSARTGLAILAQFAKL